MQTFLLLLLGERLVTWRNAQRSQMPMPSIWLGLSTNMVQLAFDVHPESSLYQVALLLPEVTAEIYQSRNWVGSSPDRLLFTVPLFLFVPSNSGIKE